MDLTPASAALTRYRWSSPAARRARRRRHRRPALTDQDRATKNEAPPGDVRAFDVRTGKLRWTFHVVPREGEPGVETWEDDSWGYTGAGNVWSLISADEELGSSTSRSPARPTTCTAATGPATTCTATPSSASTPPPASASGTTRLVHHDLWDYDFPAAPILADITVDGQPIKAVVQVTKQAFAFVFDRVNRSAGVADRGTPGAAVRPCRASGPRRRSRFRPSRRRSIARASPIDDLIDFTPELRAGGARASSSSTASVRCSRRRRSSGDGPGRYEGHDRQLPGRSAAPTGSGAAFDPETGMLYVPSMTNPFVADLVTAIPRQYRPSTTLPGIARD